MDLFWRSAEIIERSQAPSGAFPACPTFPTYRYSWFRDGAFIAHGLDAAGRHGPAEAFHRWAASTILRHQEEAQAAVSEPPWEGQPARFLHTRYTVEGEAGEEEWSNFQLDGLGAWLWSLAEHVRHSGRQPSEPELEAQRLVVGYLDALWQRPCYDLWEEFPEERHTYTLGALAGGLQAAGRWEERAGLLAERIRREIHELGTDGRAFVKFLGRSGVDASLVGLGTPYEIVGPDHPLYVETLRRIREELRGPLGGLRRYPQDTYYGGGEWVLLTAWWGWQQARAGQLGPAREALRWVEAQADPESGELPEQVGGETLDPARHAEWVERWGPPARPLLWSHAMHLILVQALRKAAG